MTSETPVSSLTIRLFGGMEVQIQGQPLPKLRSRKEYQLLALLTLAQGRARERSALAQKLWPFPDHSVDQAARYLRRSLSEVRRALGTEADRLPIQSDHTLRLDLEGAEVDVVAFDQALKQGNVEALEKAVALYTGPLLLGHTEMWVDEERESYRQHCLRALRMLCSHAQQQNDLPAQIAWLRQAAVLEPTAESIHRALMETHAAHGETAAALLVYQELSRTLHRLCNRTPDPLTTAIFRKIRDAIALPPMVAPPLISRPSLSVATVPYPLTSILGRAEETLAIRQRLERARLVTLTGMGGVGKTRLAIHIAHLVKADFPDGIWFVELADLTTPALIPERIADALKIDLRTKTGQTALQTLQEHLEQRQALLILDNCEHLHLACAHVAEALLARCGNLRLLATSRRPLGLIGENLYEVTPLRMPDSASLAAADDAWELLESYPVVQLFAERASALRSDFYLHAENIDSIVQICTTLDGIPLAIELAAARVGRMTVEQIARTLDDRFALPPHGDPTQPTRQKSLWGLIDWSYDLLTPQQQTLLAGLSIFRGGWDLLAAQAVGAGEEIDADTLPADLEGLVDHSLVIVEPGRVQTRYRMLETVRRYGQDRLEHTGLRPAVWARFRAHFLALATESERELRGSEQAKALTRLERENENLRAVLSGCLEANEGDAALRLAGLLWRFWYLRGYYAEGAGWLERALAATVETTDTILLKALTGAGNLAYAASRLDYARACYTRALTIQQKREDGRGVAAALSSLANVAQEEEYYDGARALFEDALEVFRGLGHLPDIARTLGNLARVCATEENYDQALLLHQESVALFRQSGEQQYLAQGLNLLADTLLAQGDLPAAAACLQESLTLSLTQQSRFDQAHCLIYLRKLAVKQGRWQQAAVLLGAETALREAMQMPLPSRDTTKAQHYTHQIQAHLSQEEFQGSYQQGQSMSPTAVAEFLDHKFFLRTAPSL